MSKEISVGIIGGSGLNVNNIFTPVKSFRVKTPFGDPSAVILQGNVGGVTTYYVPRHGERHSLSPTAVNYRANIWALKQLGCTHVIGTTATSSLQEYIMPGELLILSSFINRTTRRQSSFFNGDPYVGYIPMQPSFCKKMGEILLNVAKSEVYTCYPKATVVTIEGPRLPSLAESALYHSWGADLVNMTTVPEVCLAKELTMLYACIASVTDYCHRRIQPIKMKIETVIKVFESNAMNIERVIKKSIPLIAQINWEEDINLLEKIIDRSSFKRRSQPPGAHVNQYQPQGSHHNLPLMSDSQQLQKSNYFKPKTDPYSISRVIDPPSAVDDAHKLAMVDDHSEACHFTTHVHKINCCQPFTISTSTAVPVAIISVAKPDQSSHGYVNCIGQDHCVFHGHQQFNSTNGENPQQRNTNENLNATTIPSSAPGLTEMVGPEACISPTVCECPKLCTCILMCECTKICICPAKCHCPKKSICLTEDKSPKACTFPTVPDTICTPADLHAATYPAQNNRNEFHSLYSEPPVVSKGISQTITSLTHCYQKPNFELEYKTITTSELLCNSPPSLPEICPAVATFRQCNHCPMCPIGKCPGTIPKSSDFSSPQPTLNPSSLAIKRTDSCSATNGSSYMACKTLLHTDPSSGTRCETICQTLKSSTSPENTPPSYIASKTLIYTDQSSGIRCETICQTINTDTPSGYRPSSQMSCKTLCQTDPISGTRCDTLFQLQTTDMPPESNPSSPMICKTFCYPQSSFITRCDTVCNNGLSLVNAEDGEQKCNIPYERNSVSGYPRKLLNYPDVTHPK